MLKNKVLTLILLVSMVGSTFSEEPDLLSFVVYGQNHMVGVALPDTWNVNMAAARQMGVNGFFYLKQYGMNESPAGLFLRLTDVQKNTTLDAIAQEDTRLFTERHKGFIAQKTDWKIVREDKSTIIVYKLYSKTSDVYQYSAYIGNNSLPYYVNIYIQIFGDEKDNIEYENDFKTCLEKTTLSGIGMIMSE